MIHPKTKRLFAVAGLVVILDQISKAIIIGYVTLYHSIDVIPGFFSIVHIRNPGGAFGFLAGQHEGIRNVVFIFFVALAAGIVLYLFRKTPESHKFLSIGFALIFGGAIGNLIDRVRLNGVVDFLDFYVGNFHWPAFNIADSAITVGIATFIGHMLLGKLPDSE